MARIVVTGGGGFLGQRLIGALLESDRLVINGDHVSIGSLCVIDRVIPEHFMVSGLRRSKVIYFPLSESGTKYLKVSMQ